MLSCIKVAVLSYWSSVPSCAMGIQQHTNPELLQGVANCAVQFLVKAVNFLGTRYPSTTHPCCPPPLPVCPPGPRLCLGQRLAELEGVFVLTGLLARYRFSQAVPGAAVGYNLSPTMPMKQGLMVLATPRTT